MLRLKLVKGIDLIGEDDNNDDKTIESSLLYGTQVLSSHPFLFMSRLVLRKKMTFVSMTFSIQRQKVFQNRTS
jgi:hypothetical protein